jgi:hypothetical protein
VRLLDLAIVVLQQRAERAVKDAGAPAHRQRRAVAAGLDPLACGLDADQLHTWIVDEAGEHADRVGAAADACDHAVG